MTYQRLAYDDAASTPEMAADCAEVGRELRLPPFPPTGADPLSSRTTDRSAGTALDVPPSLAEMAAGLELHFD
ncbi:hypothetical protein [Nocardioides caldifontis]|uniref:hypothetical protein n=1 Tax=Nocardioides caldifontis TaxID=2588938 RepID=UPI0011DF37E5|nr:hypothetical protein [Nocardioides caldifontis]